MNVYSFHYTPYEQFKNNKFSEINAKADHFMDSLVEQYPEFEKLTFTMQADEAKRYLADPSTEVKYINVIAQLRGLTTQEIAQRIVNKDEQFSQLAFLVAGQRQSIRIN